MSYDFLGQMFGKARRRKIEAAAQQVLLGGPKPVAVDFGVLGTRLAAGATMALLNATLNHTLPATAGGILSVAGVGLTGALPTALKSSGLLTPLSPDTLSVVEGLTQAVTSILAAPANARKAAFQSAVAEQVQIALNKTNMDGYTPSELGQKAPEAQAAAPEATNVPAAAGGGETGISTLGTDAAMTQRTDAAILGTDAAILGTDAAILATGGNQ